MNHYGPWLPGLCVSVESYPFPIWTPSMWKMAIGDHRWPNVALLDRVWRNTGPWGTTLGHMWPYWVQGSNKCVQQGHQKVYHTGPNWAICGHIGWGSYHKIHYSIGGHMGFKGLWGMYIQKGAHYTPKWDEYQTNSEWVWNFKIGKSSTFILPYKKVE